MFKQLITTSAIWVILSLIVMSVTAYVLQTYIPQFKLSFREWMYIQMGLYTVLWTKSLIDYFWDLSEKISSAIFQENE